MQNTPSHNTTRESMLAFQWREFSPPLSSAHSLLQCYHSQWEIGDAAIPGEFPLSPRHYRPISQWASSLEWCHAVTKHIMVGKICISFFLFYCEGMLSLEVLWLCGKIEWKFEQKIQSWKNLYNLSHNKYNSIKVTEQILNQIIVYAGNFMVLKN